MTVKNVKLIIKIFYFKFYIVILHFDISILNYKYYGFVNRDISY